MLIGLVLSTVSVFAQDEGATATAAEIAEAAEKGGPSEVREVVVPGLAVTVELADPTSTAFKLLYSSCDAQGKVELVASCKAWVDEVAKAWSGKFVDGAPMVLERGPIKRRTKGGFVVDITGIEAYHPGG